MLNADIYLDEVEKFKRTIDRLIDEGKNIIFNLARVSFISSSFIIILAACLKRAKENNKGIVVCHAASEAKRVLRITGIEKKIPIYNTEKDALKALSGRK